MVNLTPRPFSAGNESLYPFNKTLDVSQIRSGHSGGQKTLLPVAVLEPRIVRLPGKGLDPWSCEATSCVDDVTCSRLASVATFGTTWHKRQNCKQVVSHDGSWVCYLKSVLRYKFLICNIYHPDAWCLRV